MDITVSTVCGLLVLTYYAAVRNICLINVAQAARSICLFLRFPTA